MKAMKQAKITMNRDGNMNKETPNVPPPSRPPNKRGAVNRTCIFRVCVCGV